jgi:hypothetical protein
VLHQYLRSCDGKKKVVQRVEGYRIVQTDTSVVMGVVINYIRIVYWYCCAVTKVAHAFRGELEGEPRSKIEDGLSMRARILST